MTAYNVTSSAKTPAVKVKTNSKKERQEALAALVKGVQSGARRIESYLPTLLNKAMESSVWDWPRPTLRENGSTAGTTRNIVDTGALKSSLSVSVKFLKTKTNFLVKYSAPYATLVHEGGYIAPYGRTDLVARSIPGRPWITAVMDGGYNGIESIDIQSEMLTAIEGAW